MLTRIVRLSFKKEYHKDFIILFKEIKPSILDQPGCISVDLLNDIEDNNSFITVSKWKNLEALNNYRSTDFFKKTWAILKPNFTNQAQAHSYMDATN